jgi:hypothetical protein
MVEYLSIENLMVLKGCFFAKFPSNIAELKYSPL